ncbi:hypothetical protein BJX76DRAFT_352648 [Aspergillus varians]
MPGSLVREYEEGKEWIKGAVICTWGTGFILALNVILSIVAMGIGYSKSLNQGLFQSISLYDGNCTVSNRWATGLHLLININSSSLLAASNYVMQCLAAPSRSDVDKAHKQRKWLDIGTFSLRNLAVMDAKHCILWALLLLSSTPIHMIYNSVVFPSISTFDYAPVLIPDDLSPSEPLTAGGDETANFITKVGIDPAVLQVEIFNGTFRNLSTQDCFKMYNVELNTHLGTPVFTAGRQYFHNATSLFGSFGEQPYSSTEVYIYLNAYETWGTGSADQMVNNNNVSVHGGHWAYRLWNFTLPAPVSVDNISFFTTYNIWELRNSDFSTINVPMGHDLATLDDYMITYNPDREELGAFLKTPSHWANSTWAASLKFQLGNKSIFANSVGPNSAVGPTRIPVSQCMSKSRDQRCQLFFSPAIAIAVIISNVIKLACMYLTARTGRTNILLTLGDAISSFLMRPDPTTEGQCLMSRADAFQSDKSPTAVTIGRLRRRRRSVDSTMDIPLVDTVSTTGSLPHGPTTLPTRKRRFQAASGNRWAATFIFLFGCLAASIYLFCIALSSSAGSIPGAWRLGFGKASEATMIWDENISDAMISLVLLSNTPHMVLSILYFLCNSLMTCMLLAAEWSNYATQRQPLRVSWPKGQQRSKYYLSLPYQYSVPLVLFSVLMHWFLSQSIFFVYIQSFGLENEPNKRSTRGCGYSPIAMFFVLILAFVGMLALLGVSIRPLNSRMPLVSSCSAAISAACHPPPDDHEAALKPVIWGEIVSLEECNGRDQNWFSTGHRPSTQDSAMPKYAHCTFTSHVVNPPRPGQLYW